MNLFLQCDGSLLPLIKRVADKNGLLTYPLTRRASIKDVIEALGVPHTEIGAILHQGEERGFGTVPKPGETYTLLPTSPERPVTKPSLLRPFPFHDLRFMVDKNVNKLARLLRMAGYDAAPVPEASLREVARVAMGEQRVVLTRNSDLLKVKEVVFGHLLRTQDSVQQFREVAVLYRLVQDKAPFSRCLECNSPLQPVDKEAVLERLEPLTKKYYSVFHRCPNCDKLYWRGSHHEKMRRLIDGLAPSTS